MSWELTTGVILVGSMFFFIYLANSLTQDKWFHHAMKLLLFMMSFWIMYIGGSLSVELARANTATASVLKTLQMLHNVLLYTAVISTILFMLYFLWEALKAYKIKNTEKYDSILGK